MDKPWWAHGLLIIECPVDQTFLMGRATAADGNVLTLGDRGVTWTEEFVSDFDPRAVADNGPDDAPHFRYTFHCPTCAEAGRAFQLPPLRQETVHDVLDRILRACHETKQTYTVTDLNKLLRDVSRAAE